MTNKTNKHMPQKPYTTSALLTKDTWQCVTTAPGKGSVIHRLLEQ